VIDYEQLAARSLDEPLDADERAALRVWGDALEAAGDPRGVLIALEHAILAEPGRRHALASAANAHVLAKMAPELGPMAELLAHKRAVELEWRAGMLHGVFVDIRRLPKTHELAPVEVMEKILDAPIMRTVRRLHVRMRRLDDRYQILPDLNSEHRDRFPPLEEIAILAGLAPRTIERPSAFEYTTGGPTDWAGNWSLDKTYPHLRLLVFDEAITPVPFAGGHAARFEASMRLSDPVARAQLGRELTSGAHAIRMEALLHVVKLGAAAFAFVETLMWCLAPGMPQQAEVLRALMAIGAPARLALPQVAVITGRPAHYERVTRQTAGVALRVLGR
jgi:hypothetical protein